MHRAQRGGRDRRESLHSPDGKGSVMTRDTRWTLGVLRAVGVGLAIVMVRVPGGFGVPERVGLWVLLMGVLVIRGSIRT
jgi:hypothetical protein